MIKESERYEEQVDMKNLLTSKYKSKENDKRIAVIGAGWFGTHTAIELSKLGYLITLYEKNATIFSGTSGTFGVRIHAGPHYPRSLSTRKTCRDGFNEMLITYPELCNKHMHAVYALGKKDADGEKSKVEEKSFDSVCKEFKFKGKFDLENSPFNPSEIISAYDIDEPSAVLGTRLRIFFEARLQEAKVAVKCNFTITIIKKFENFVMIGNESEEEKFDSVVDATGFQQTFLPFSKSLPFNINIFYQPCLALVYSDRCSKEKPISFIVMDGWFPCLMPYDDRLTTDKPIQKYILTHGKWTILGSYRSAEEAHKAFSVVNDDFVENKVKPSCEKEMIRFWPGFLDRFNYIGWKGSVLGKMKTEREFRGSILFQEPTVGVISIFPGKITNIFDSAREVQKLIEAQNVKVSMEGYRYIEGGILDSSKVEIAAPVITENRNTCSLTTFQDTLEELQKSRAEFNMKEAVCTQAPRNCSKGYLVKMIALGLMLIAIKKNFEKFNKSNSIFFGVVACSMGAAYLYKNRFSIQNYLGFNLFKKPSQMKIQGGEATPARTASTLNF